MQLSQTVFEQIVERANLAPSVHNTQPTRWRLETDGSILLAGILSRHLLSGDPQFRDMGISCGAALEGTVLALAENGFEVAKIDDLWSAEDVTSIPGFRLAARVRFKEGGKLLELSNQVLKRFTWRGGFRKPSYEKLQQLGNWAENCSDITLITNPADINDLSKLGDEASISFLRDKHFRFELLNWMRLTPNHTDFHRDGLNLDAIHMARIEGLGAKLVLGTNLFGFLDSLGIAKSITGEAAKTKSAGAIALFHRPQDESFIQSGRAFYQNWLHITRLGLSAWPLAALADNPVSAAICHKRFAINNTHKLVSALRLGEAQPERLKRARLPASDLML